MNALVQALVQAMNRVIGDDFPGRELEVPLAHEIEVEIRRQRSAGLPLDPDQIVGALWARHGIEEFDGESVPVLMARTVVRARVYQRLGLDPSPPAEDF